MGKISKLIILVVIVILTAASVFLIEFIYYEEVGKHKELLGKRVIIDKDTFLITNYSLIFEEYELHDGTEIGFYAIENFKIID